MNRIASFARIAALGLLIPTVAFSQDPNFHVYLALGQSNMDGAGDIEAQDRIAVDPRFKNLSTVTCTGRVLGQWYQANTPLGRCTAGLSPMDYFGRTMVARLPTNVSVGVAVVAVAGAKIELWDKTAYEAYADTAPSWMQGWINEFNGNPYARLVEVGKIAKQTGVIKGIMLHQGESNSGEGTVWLGKVKKIYNDLITDLNLDPTKVPLLAGELVSRDEGGVCWGHNATIGQLPTVIPNSHVISSAGLPDKGDGLHFSSESYRTFGKRYAEKMLTLLDTTPVVVVPTRKDSVFNGNFANGTSGWTLNVWAGVATGAVTNGEYKASITSIGTSAYQIQLIQNGILLKQGQSYEIKFDAYASTARSIEVNVEKDVSPWTSYLGQPKQVALTTTKQTFTHSFRMAEATDSNSRISFNLGMSTSATTLDNISIKPIADPVFAAYAPEFRNTLVSYHAGLLKIENALVGNSPSQLSIHDLQGRQVFTQEIHTGVQSLDASSLAEGIYFLHIRSGKNWIHSSRLVISE